MEPKHLGKTSSYMSEYAPDLLEAIPREVKRQEIGLAETNLPFFGHDWWNGYEVSWLNTKGKPQVAILVCRIPFDSPNLIESKSFKLYLNSFNQSRFHDQEEVLNLMQQDLSAIAGKPVELHFQSLNEMQLAMMPGECIDELDVEIQSYHYTPQCLSRDEQSLTEETFHSHLLKSNCLITEQPDWASLVVAYKGPSIDKAAFLQYLISFRQHNEFHEQCVERIFVDTMKYCQPEKLAVYARYTRRGGLDINPLRTNFMVDWDNWRLSRQ
ncbi:MAG: NADPH-dependent 7-cyano-7-deazaguanine reductase QueF [Pseudomonadota bacterium]